MTNKERRQMRMRQIEQFLASGMPAAEWMRLNRMSSSTFYLWLNKFRDEDPGRFGCREKPGSWVEVSRDEMRGSVAIEKAAPVEAPEPAARTGALAAEGAPPATGMLATAPIRITAGNVTVEVPFAGESTLAAVLRAVVRQ